MKKLQTFMLRPRYLRAIPSLVVLTTAMAWSVLPDTDADSTPDRASTSLSQELDRTGAGRGPLHLTMLPGKNRF